MTRFACPICGDPDVLVTDTLDRFAALPARAGEVEDYAKPIVARDDVQGGQPCFAGTRIPVCAVWSFLEAGHSPAEIVRQYPSLTEGDVRVARDLFAITRPTRQRSQGGGE